MAAKYYLMRKNEPVTLVMIDELGNMRSFAARETSMLQLVRDRRALDLTKLPPASFIRESHAKDSQMNEHDINLTAHWYERKIDLCRRFQQGQSLTKMRYVP